MYIYSVRKVQMSNAHKVHAYSVRKVQMSNAMSRHIVHLKSALLPVGRA